MTKKLNTKAITNDLEGSAFFPNIIKAATPLPQQPLETPSSEKLITLSEQPKLHIPERTNAQTTQRPVGKRIITRNSFEIYEDQMDSLRKLSYQEKMEGKLGSMSGMVREAVDNYLLKRTQKK